MSAFSSLSEASSAAGLPRPPRRPPLEARRRRASVCSGSCPTQYAEPRIACALHLPPSALIPLQSAIAYTSPGGSGWRGREGWKRNSPWSSRVAPPASSLHMWIAPDQRVQIPEPFAPEGCALGHLCSRAPLLLERARYRQLAKLSPCVVIPEYLLRDVLGLDAHTGAVVDGPRGLQS